jgi:hypothetical protein
VARTNATNFSGGLQFPYATAANDVFKKEDVQVLAQAVDQHTHAAGLGHQLAAGAIPNGLITSAMIVDGTIATADLADGSVTTAKHADASVTNAKLGPDVARANLLTNGGFEVWQRGNGPFSANAAYGPDRWTIALAGTDALSISRNTANVDAGGSQACAAATYTLGSGGGSALYSNLKVSDGNQLAGRTLSLSMRVSTATANAVRIALTSDGSGGTTTYSAYHSGGGVYQTLSVTAAIPSNATIVAAQVWFTASCTAYLDNAMLVVGSQYADYVPMHPADDLARCLRYYEVHGGGTNFFPFLAFSAQGAGHAISAPIGFAVQKAVTPTVTKTGTWTVANCGQPTADLPSLKGYRFFITSTAAGNGNAQPSGAGDTLVFESNP